MNPLKPSPIVSESDKKFADKWYKRWQAGIDYKVSQGLFSEWKEYEDFWNADQWAAPNKNNRNFPRPVTNTFSEIIEQKVAALTYEFPELFFLPLQADGVDVSDPLQAEVVPYSEDEEMYLINAAEMLTFAAKYQAEKIDMQDLLDVGVRTSGLLGTAVWFFPWDNQIVGGSPQHRWIGDIAGYELDPADFVPGDPTQRKIQRQPWLIFTERLPIDQAREKYKTLSKGLTEALQADENTNNQHRIYSQQIVEQRETNYVDLLHCWEKVIVKEEVVTGEDEPLYRYRPQVNYYVFSQQYKLRESKDIYENGMYPFVSFQWYPRRKCFFGKPESKDIIANQKEKNKLQGIGLMTAYQTGAPNIRFREGFVKRSDIPVGPGGGIIPDESPIPHWSIDYMQPPSVAPYIHQLKDSLEVGMKESSGIQEAWTGKAPSAQLNASAIIALQEAAGVRIRGIQRRLHTAIKDIGRIWLGHWKQFYTEKRLSRISGNGKPEGLYWFAGTDYADMEFDIHVQVSGTSPFSRTTVVSFMEGMYDRKIITAEEYVELMPADVFPMMLQLRELRKKNAIIQERMIMEQKMAVINQIVGQTIAQAAQAGVQVDQNALLQMLQMVTEADTVQE